MGQHRKKLIDSFYEMATVVGWIEHDSRLKERLGESDVFVEYKNVVDTLKHYAIDDTGYSEDSLCKHVDKSCNELKSILDVHRGELY